MSDRTVLALLREDQLTLYAMNGTGEAHELAKLRVSDQTPNGIASLVQGLVPFLAKQAPVPRSGILASAKRALPPYLPPTKRAVGRPRGSTVRMSTADRAERLRQIVAAHPGITRQQVLDAMNMTNPSGTSWSAMVEVSGVKKTKEGAGRSAKVRYWPPDMDPATEPPL